MLIQQTYTCFWRDEFDVASGVSALAGVSRSGQPLGSMPWRFNSFLASSLNQLPRLVPSFAAAASSCSFNSGLILIWNAGALPLPLGCLSRVIEVDMCVPIGIAFISIGPHLNISDLSEQRPAVLATHTGRLTKPLIEVTVMAVNKHTQTRPKYQYRFLAISRQDRSVPPFRLCIDAGSELEARRLLAPYFILSFAGQLPVQEARNA